MSVRLIDHLAPVADLASPSTDELSALVEESANFLRSSGTITMTEWCVMSPVERAALVEASTIILAERASVYGFAAQGPAAAAKVGARADGGDMSRAMALRAVVEAVASRASNPESPIPVDSR